MFLIQKWEDIDYVGATASTVFLVGDCLSYVSGKASPAAALGLPILGVNLIPISTTDSDYASTTKKTAYQMVKEGFKFICSVGAGTAVEATHVGNVYNVYASNSGQIDLSAYNTLTYITLAVGVFGVGNTITGTTSGATGVITRILPSGQLTYTTAAGTFVTGELITDGTTGATARIQTVKVGGTQLRVLKVLSTTLVEVEVALAA